MLDRQASPAARVSAASAILDRGYGRAAQDINVSQGNPIDELSGDELREMISALRTGLEQGLFDADRGPLPALEAVQ
jgi:hypothetical protein